MICEVRNENTEVALRDAKFSDVLAVLQIWIQKDKEICYTRPAEEEEEEE